MVSPRLFPRKSYLPYPSNCIVSNESKKNIFCKGGMGFPDISSICNVANDAGYNADVEKSQPGISRCPAEVFVAVGVELYTEI